VQAAERRPQKGTIRVTTALDEATYATLVSKAFKRLLAALDSQDPDVLEAESTGDMVTITAPANGQKVVVNTQRAVKQLWVAGQGLGIHFDYDAATDTWLDDKGKGKELFAWVAECVAAISGLRLPL
jgi:CyaY protein